MTPITTSPIRTLAEYTRLSAPPTPPKAQSPPPAMTRADIRRLRTQNFYLTPKRGTERWLTGYSDASFKPDAPEGGGGWGCWVRDSHTRILRSGPCPDWVTGATDAELCGVFATVHTALTRLDSAWANILVIKLDNQDVARWFGWQYSDSATHLPKRPEQIDLVLRALQAATDKQIRLVVTWVKGHRGASKDTSAYLNTQVDRMAGAARRNRQNTVVTMSAKERAPSQLNPGAIP